MVVKKRRVGRPSLKEGQQTVQITARLHTSDIEYVKRLADGNFSEGIRRIIEAHVEHTAKAA